MRTWQGLEKDSQVIPSQNIYLISVFKVSQNKNKGMITRNKSNYEIIFNF